MSRIPRLLPLVGVAVGGVLAVKGLADINALPRVMAGARAFAEEVQEKPAGKPAAKGKAAAKAEDHLASEGAETATSAPAPAGATPLAAAPPLVCAPSADALAKEAGLSPAELQVLQSLGNRRTQLDAREQDLDTQLKLLAAAEIKLDAKLKGLTGLKADLQALLGQTEQKESAEIDRLVTVFSKMKPKDAAPVMVQLEDKVRLPVAGKMKEATLAAILSQMPASEAKKLTESLAHRFDQIQQMAQNATQPAPAAATAAAPAAAAPTEDKAATEKAAAAAPKPAARRPTARRNRPAAAKPAAQAAAAQAAAATPKPPVPAAPAVPPTAAPAPPAPQAAAAAPKPAA